MQRTLQIKKNKQEKLPRPGTQKAILMWNYNGYLFGMLLDQLFLRVHLEFLEIKFFKISNGI